MSENIDIHQLDAKRQVLLILKESRSPLSIAEIRERLLARKVSPVTSEIKGFLSYTLRDLREPPRKDGWVFMDQQKFTIMQKGIEYLENSIFVIDPAHEESTHETLENLFAGVSGDVKLCDPYFDENAYSKLRMLLNPQKINSLKVVYCYKKIDRQKPHVIGRHHISLAKSKQDIHDRFLIDKEHLYIFGTSLNNIGGKLSFVFNLSSQKRVFEGIFEKLWGEADVK